MLKAEVLARLMRPFRVEAAKVWVSRLFTSTLPLLAVAFRLSRLPPGNGNVAVGGGQGIGLRRHILDGDIAVAGIHREACKRLRGSLTVMVQMHLLLFTLMEASPLRP